MVGDEILGDAVERDDVRRNRRARRLLALAGEGFAGGPEFVLDLDERGHDPVAFLGDQGEVLEIVQTPWPHAAPVDSRFSWCSSTTSASRPGP